MIEIDVERLRSVGLTPAQAAALLQLSTPPMDAGWGPAQAMRLVELHRETVLLHDGLRSGAARTLPWLARALAQDDDGLAVGDWVLAAADPHGQRWVTARVEPLTHLARRDADGRRHPVVSNVDTALLVMGLDDDFNPRRLERYLALVQGSGVAPLVVLTKADVMATRVDERLAALQGRVPASVEVMAVDGTAPATAQRLAPWLGAGQTLVLLGSSGAGKSTLTNTLLGTAVQDTGAVREHDSRGKHTTTSRSLHCLSGGACVIDTPGLRALRPDNDEARLAQTFEDIATLALACRFRDCTHHDEPACAVREGVGADRLRNYHKLLREARRDTMSVLERQRQLSEWKSRTRSVRAFMKGKRDAR